MSPEKLDTRGQMVSASPSNDVRIHFISIKHESKHIASASWCQRIKRLLNSEISGNGVGHTNTVYFAQFANKQVQPKVLAEVGDQK